MIKYILTFVLTTTSLSFSKDVTKTCRGSLCSSQNWALIKIEAQNPKTQSDKKAVPYLKSLLQDKLTASDATTGDRFGYSVSLSGNRALIGASLDSEGSAYIFEFDGVIWNQMAKLTAVNGVDGDHFGNAVSLDGDRALIGARYDENTNLSGSAYIFDFDGISWNQTTQIMAPIGTANDYFGSAVSLSGDRVVIGAYGHQNNDSSGSAYIFEFDGNNWNQTIKLIASDAAVFDEFGSTVSLDEDRLLIGAYKDDDNGLNSGSAYIFEFDGTNWIEAFKLTADDGAIEDYFGSAISLYNDRALIGAYHDQDIGYNSGSAYVFEFDGLSWIQTTKLTASDGAPSDLFGLSVSLDDNRALIGAFGDDDNGLDSGSAYIFEYDGIGWNENTKLTASDGFDTDRFAFSLDLSGSKILIGAYADDDDGEDSGSAYAFLKGGIFSNGFE